LIEEIIVSSLILGGLYALLSLGFSLIRGVAKIMNFAHGAFYMLAGYMIFSALYLGLGVAIVISTTLIIVVSLIAYRLIIGPLREKESESALITFALALLIQEIVKLVWGPDYKSIPYMISGYVSIIGVRVVSQKVLALIAAIICVTVLFLFIKKSRVGKATRAVSQNIEVARLVGINVTWVLMISMAISALLAAIAAVFFAPLTVLSPNDWSILFHFMPVIVLGGLGNLKGTAVASFVIAFIEKTVEFTIGGGYLMQTVTFGIMLLVLFIKPGGLFGKSKK